MDQYLSPTWSPDGRELILVSNRGHIWGSGGFWRMEARPGGAAREIHDEETTWKARPDWSRDGRRVVYSSYLGGQWHQLWLMTPDGANPLQLTYGEFDATAPRWSSDGRRIAYVSNEGGNTSLWVRRGARRATGRRFARSGGAIARRWDGCALRVIDAAGAPVPARVSVTGPDGRSCAPDDAWRHADDGFDRRERRFEYGYFHTAGLDSLTLPAGEYAVEVTRGPETRVERRTVADPRRRTTPRSGSRCARSATSPGAGWYSGDLHVHMNYGGAYRNTPRRLAFQARAEDLRRGREPDRQQGGAHPGHRASPVGRDPVSTATTVDRARPGVPHELLGSHRPARPPRSRAAAGLRRLREHRGGQPLRRPTPRSPIWRTRRARWSGYVHPFDSDPDPADTTQPLTDELPVDVALGKVDYYEALGFVDDPMATAHVWYRALNCGFRLPAGAGTDAMANFASLRGPVGMNRVYVRTGGRLDQRRLLDSLQGRPDASPPTGRCSSSTVGGPRRRRRAPARDGTPRGRSRGCRLRSNVPVDHLEIVGNGEVVRGGAAGRRSDARRRRRSGCR